MLDSYKDWFDSKFVFDPSWKRQISAIKDFAHQSLVYRLIAITIFHLLSIGALTRYFMGEYGEEWKRAPRPVGPSAPA